MLSGQYADAEKDRGKEGKEGKKGGGGGVSEELRAEEGEAAALRDLDERCAKGAATRRGYGHMDAANHEFTALVVFAALAPLLSPPTKSTKPTEPTGATNTCLMQFLFLSVGCLPEKIVSSAQTNADEVPATLG